MALSWRTLRALPRFSSYKQASDYEMRIKPIRGRPDCKPLGRRKQTHLRISRDPDTCAISVHYGWGTWGKTIFTYFPDGFIVIPSMAGTHQRATEVDILGQVLSMHCVSFDGNVWAYDARTQHKLPFNVGRPSHFRHDANHSSPLPLNLKPKKIHLVNRKRTNQVRKRYAQFIQYAKAMDSIDPHMREDDVREMLRGEPFAHAPSIYTRAINNPMNYQFSREQAHALAQLMISDDPEDRHLAWLNCAYNYRYYNKAVDNIAHFTAVTQRVVNAVLFRAHKDECLDYVEDLTGQLRKDTYAWA
jgi:hypothetical protein